MMDFWYIFLLSGVVIGWATKIPLFLTMYKDWEDEKLEIWKCNKRILELMKDRGI